MINFLVIWLFVPYVLSLSINNDIKIDKVEREIDISTQIVLIHNRIELINSGKDIFREFVFTVEPEFADHVTTVSATAKHNSLNIFESNLQNHKVWVIKLANPLSPKSSLTINLQYELTQVLSPYPTHISQNEKQLVKYTGNSYFYSFYDVRKSSTVIDLKTRTVEDYTKVEPTRLVDTRIYYGPYENLRPLSKSSVSIHYLNNSPFLVVTRLERSVEISHWGNIAIEDEVTMVNKGAKLKGSFSRFDYQKDSGSPTVHAFRTILPVDASDIYYRDEIGNISTSIVYHHANNIEIELRPRFPLFGGWTTQYKLGYNVPTSSYLFSKDSQYLLKMPVVDLIYRNMVIEEAVVNIILPEGSTEIDLICPFDVVKLNRTLHFTYLDVIGRPVVAFEKYNLIEHHHALNFELRYVFPKVHMLREPFVLIVSLFLFFALVMIYVRLDFSITVDEVVEQKLRISGFCSKILSHHDSRISVYQNVEEKLSSFKHNKDVNTLNLTMKLLNNDHKYYTGEINDLLAKLKQESSELADKVTELQKLDKQLKDLFSQQQTLYMDKLLPGKISKSAFAEMDENINKKKEECIEKINKLVRAIE